MLRLSTVVGALVRTVSGVVLDAAHGADCPLQAEAVLQGAAAAQDADVHRQAAVGGETRPGVAAAVGVETGQRVHAVLQRPAGRRSQPRPAAMRILRQGRLPW